MNSSIQASTATTGRTVLALGAILSLLLALFGAAATQPGTVLAAGDHCPSDTNGAPSGAVNGAEGDASEQDVSITYGGDPGVVTLTNNNDTDATVVFCAKGGNEFEGDSKNSGEITATLAPDETQTFEFGTEISYFVLYSVTVDQPEQPAETVQVSIMKHLCDEVTTVAEFNAVENAGAGGQEGGFGTVPGLVATVLACPTIVLTGDVPTPGAITTGEVDFDFAVIDADGTQILSSDGDFVQQALCEDDVMVDVDEDGTIEDDVCLDTSMYMFEVVDGMVEISETQVPAGSTGLGTIRFTPGSEDETALATSIEVVETTGVITLDTSAASATALADGIVIHAYNFAEAAGGGEEPETVQVSIMKHLCDEVTTVDEFNAVENAGAGGQEGGFGTVPGLVATVLACPTIVLTGDVPTPGAITTGEVDFDFAVIDADGTQILSSDGDFVQQALCEDDVMVDVDEDGTIEDDVCLDTSMYMFEVVDGMVEISETQVPAGSTGLGTIRFTPGSEDETALATSIEVVETTGVITLDTSAASATALEGGIVIHAYNFAEEDEGPQSGGTNPDRDGTLGGNPLPDTASAPIPTGSVPAALLALLMLSGLGGAGYAMATEARRRR